MEGQSKETTLIIIIVFVVLVASLVGIGFLVTNIISESGGLFEENNRSQIPSVFQSPGDNSDSEEEQVPDNNLEPQDFGSYNFTIAQSGAYIDLTPNEALDYNFNISVFEPSASELNVETGVKDEGLVSELMIREADREIVSFGNMNRIRIPVVGIDTPVLQGSDGDTLLNSGWWLHPASYTTTSGEKILYCHRRYFGRNDSRTCWNLDKLVDGHEIVTYNKNGDSYRYKVISKSIIAAENTVYVRPSQKDYIKIITCGTESGAPGGNDYRVVVLAELVE